MNPWKLTSLLLAIALFLVVRLHAVDPASAAPEPQPHMRTALHHLRIAKEELVRANTDKGGHRVKAIELTGAAIEQVMAGIRFDNRHAAE